MHGSPFIVVGLQSGAVFLGHFCGVATHYPGRAPSGYTTFAMIASLLMACGVTTLHAAHTLLGPSRRRTAVCVAVLLYSFAVVLWEPFLDVHRLSEVVRATLVLAPLLLTLGYLVRAEAWPSVAGVTLFVFTSSAMITSNANVSDAGSGFFLGGPVEDSTTFAGVESSIYYSANRK